MTPPHLIERTAFPFTMLQRFHEDGISIYGTIEEVCETVGKITLEPADWGDGKDMYCAAYRFPGETVKRLVTIAVDDPSLMYTAAGLLSDKLRVCSECRCTAGKEKLLITALTDVLLFHPESDHLNIPQRVVDFIRCLQWVSRDNVVISDEEILADWMDDSRFKTSGQLPIIIETVTLMFENHHSEDEWKDIAIPSLLIFFIDCLMDICWDLDRKNRFLVAMRSILKNNVQRSITKKELEQVRSVYPYTFTQLLIFYFQPYTYCSILDMFDRRSLDKADAFLIISILDRDLIRFFPPPEIPITTLNGIIPFLLPDELTRLYDYLIHFYDPVDVVDNFVDVLRTLCRNREPVQWDQVTRVFQHLFVHDFRCGQSAMKIRLDRDSDSSLEDDSTEDYSTNKIKAFQIRKLKQKKMRITRSFQIQQKRDSSLFMLMHHLLMLEYQLKSFADEDNASRVIKDVIQTFAYGTNCEEPEEDMADGFEIPTRSYSRNLNLWALLTEDQRYFLKQLDPHLADWDKKRNATITK